ncbi:hypothetical protein BSZ07_37810 [Streptomyces sp. M1013]|uniref:DUF2589 domain-containing protein n=1 Tax=Streptomyces sp. M1013 TaxID=549798 RepID=UPI00097903A4|nr:DUF2589 domain-containing protein [Streptomyces sp. M1013]OMI84642.1 hypothetical protein BSZ07_37810 [Streptomyces sp. M1013]
MSDDDVPVGALLGAAYQAVVHGQNMAAREAVELVRQLGFEKDGTAKPFRFAYQRTEATEDGPQVRTVHATVPLLSLVNPPAISIDKAAISMSLHLISQSTENGPAYTSASGSGVAAAEGAMPRLKGRIVHKSDKNATLTIESTLKQRDLLGSSRLSQLLDAAVSDRDSVWYQVLEQAEAFRTAAAAFIDAVARDGSTGTGVGVRQWLQQLWQLKESVTDAVSAYRDGLLEKIPELHQRWGNECQKLTWIDRHTEPEEMAALRRAFIAAARHVWNALLPGKPVAAFGPPTLDQLRDRFHTAVAALAAAPPGLEGLPERLRDLEGAVAQGCIAREYKQPEDVVTATLDRYNQTAETIRTMWNLLVQSPESRAAQDELASAAKDVWDALLRDTEPVDFRTAFRGIEGLESECRRLLGELETQARRLLPARRGETTMNALEIARGSARAVWIETERACREQTPLAELTRKISQRFATYNKSIGRVNEGYSEQKQRLGPEWNTGARVWNEAARRFWAILLDTRSRPVTDIAELGSP